MNEPSKWSEPCAVAGPIVRAAVGWLAERHRLSDWDREDLEQEFYLRLLVGWNAGGPLPDPDRVERSSPGTSPGPGDDGNPTASRLTGDVDRIAASLVMRWPFRRRGRPASAGPLTPSAADMIAARLPRDEHAHDLRLDLSLALSRLPSDLLEVCHRLFADDFGAVGDVPSRQAESDAVAEPDAPAVVLRSLFASLDMHHYL